MRTIRTVFQPDTTREVEDAEAAQLEREGLLLLLEPDAPAAPPAAPAAAKAAAETTPTPAKEATLDGGKAQ